MRTVERQSESPPRIRNSRWIWAGLAAALLGATAVAFALGQSSRREILPERRNALVSLASSPDGGFLASGEESNGVKVWNRTTRKNTATVQTATPDFGRIVGLSYTRLVTASTAHGAVGDRLWRGAKVWNLPDKGGGLTLRRTRTVGAMGRLIRALDVSPRDVVAVACSSVEGEGQTVVLFDMETGRERSRLAVSAPAARRPLRRLFRPSFRSK